MRERAVSLFVAICLGSTSGLVADSKRHLDDIVPGMSQNDVQKLWGEPDNKAEYESKREESWTYGDYRIKFRQGAVLRAVKTSPSYSAFYQIKKEEAPKVQRPAPAPKDVAVEDILSEITQEPAPEKKGKGKPKRRR